MQITGPLILIIGLPGTGKSTLARKFSDLLDLPIVTTEVVRARLYSETSVDEDKDFTPEELLMSYNVVIMIADTLLSVGKGVIVEGVFRSREQRRIIMELAEKHKAGFLGIYTSCSDEVVLERLRIRKQKGTMSPAGERTYLKLKDSFEPVESVFLKVETES